MKLRKVEKIVTAMATSDGAGVALFRSIGSPLLGDLDPFLLLDEFRTEDADDYIAGFPDHPHRGFETVTYMLDGRMRHEDSTGAGGSLGPGGVQWMSAGRGIIHSEMPEQEDGTMRGFQLWVNLPAAKKMSEPRYQNIEPEDVPEVTRDDGVKFRIVAGTAEGVAGAVSQISVAPVYLDITLPAGTSVRQAIPAGHTAFVYVVDGAVEIGSSAEAGEVGQLAVLGDGDEVDIRAPGDSGGDARVLVIAGRPLGEPIARYGPFVMNTRAEIEQAIRDFQSGNF